MSSIFASIYELFFYNQNYLLIFDQLYNGPGYFAMGILLIFLPALLMMFFYWDYRFKYRNPYWGWKTWGIWLVASAAITAVLTYVLSYQFIFGTDNEALNEALNDPDLNFNGYANYLVRMYTILNGIGALITGFLHSLWLKQFSKLHIHIPF